MSIRLISLSQKLINRLSQAGLIVFLLKNSSLIHAEPMAGGSFYLQNGTFINSGSAFFAAQSADLTGGHLTNINGAKFAQCALGPITINGSLFSGYNDAQSQLGPMQIDFMDGTLTNHGLISLDLLKNEEGAWQRQNAVSSIIGGSIVGNGQMWIAGLAYLEVDVKQKKITLGQGLDTSNLSSPVTASATLILNDVILTTPCAITSLGTLEGTGELSLISPVNGQIYPGPNTNLLGTITAKNDVTFQGPQSGIAVNLNDMDNSVLNVQGALTLDAASTIWIKSLENPPRGYITYTIAKSQKLKGSFPKLVNETTYDSNLFSLDNKGDDLVIYGNFPPDIQPPPVSNPSLASAVEILNVISGDCPPSTQAIINFIIFLPPEQLAQALQQLVPAFKKAQFIQEKLDLLMHKEISDILYSKEPGFNPFVIAGYDNIHRKQIPGKFFGYNNQAYYQLFGASASFKNARWLLGFGFSESYMHTIPNTATSQFTTQYLYGGLSTHFSCFKLGVDSIFSNAKLYGERNLSYFGFTAKNNHGLWNLSFEANAELEVLKKGIHLNLYNETGYNLGKERPYLEYDAPGVNQLVDKEHISVFRNALGFKLFTPPLKKISCYLDAAWVVDRYINSRYFYSSYEGTSKFGKYPDIYPPFNLARIHTGVNIHFKMVDSEISYTSLFSKQYSENSFSLKIKLDF
jgi:hypothetical protein